MSGEIRLGRKMGRYFNKENMKHFFDEIKTLLSIVAIPGVVFILSVIFNFIFFPYDAESSAKVIIYSTSTAATVAILIICYRIYLYMKLVGLIGGKDD
jgi:hypothetical protein